jgi:hypothetical protein
MAARSDDVAEHRHEPFGSSPFHCMECMPSRARSKDKCFISSE